MLALHTDGNGKVYLVQREGRDYRPGEDPELDKQLAEWAGKLDPPVDLKGDFLPGAVLFFDRDTLANLCRRYGVMLHTTGTHFTKGGDVIWDGRQWVSLMRAVAVRPEGEGPHNPSGIAPGHTKLLVPQSLFDRLSDVFTEGNENAPLWCVSSNPVKRAFVYLDISGFSKYPPGQEALIINSLVGILQDMKRWNYIDAADTLRDMEAQLCIGDGYIYVFPDPLKATLFASWMAELIQQMVARREQMGASGLPVAFHFRIGVHYGPVYRFYDPGRDRWNYIGDGINGGNRVLSVIDKKYDDILFVSDAVVNEFIARNPRGGIYANVRNCLENRGRQEDKHGKPWRVYLLNHTKLCEQAIQASLA